MLTTNSSIHCSCRRFYIFTQTSVLRAPPWLYAESFLQMDPQNCVRTLIAMAEAALGRERRRKRQMQLSLRARQAALQEKRRQRAILLRNKQDKLAEKAAKEKFIDNFMVFIEAIENNDPEIARNFDQKAMMNTILSMMKSDYGHGGDNGGFVGGDNVPIIKLDIEEKALTDATLAIINGNCGGDSGGFAGDNGGINNAPENAPNHDEEAMRAADEGTNSDGSEGGDDGCVEAPLLG